MMTEESFIILGLSIILYGVIAIVCMSFKLSFIHLVALFVVRITLPLIYFYKSFALEFVVWLLISSAFLMLGCLMGVKTGKLHPQSNLRIRFDSKAAVIFSLVVGLILVTYHYSVVGLPILSDNIDIVRFQQRGSGLLGIPSRFAVYFPALALIVSVILYQAKYVSKTVFMVMLLVCLLFFTVQGNKSSILSFVFVLLCTKRFWVTPMIGRSSIVFFLLIGTAFLYVMFGRFNTIANVGFGEYFFHRMTYLSLEPIYSAYLAQGFVPNLVASSVIVNDLIYPIGQILGVDVVTFNAQLSRYIYGFDANQFSVPVTPSIFAYYKFEFGVLGSVLACFFTGFMLAKLYSRTNGYKGLRELAFLIFIEYQVYTGLTGGNLFYLTSNILLVILVYYISIVFYKKTARAYKLRS